MLLRAQIVLLNNAEELRGHVDRSQLTADLGGVLQYDHRQWIQHRAVRLTDLRVLFLVKCKIYWIISLNMA